MDTEMKVIHEYEYTLEDGTRVKVTVSTAGGQSISEEDRAAISRLLPLSAGMALEAATEDG